MKIDPKCACLYAFFLICLSCPFQNLQHDQKTYLFSPDCAPLNDVCTYIAWSWKTTLITWFYFWRGWYPTSNTSGSPGGSEGTCEISHFPFSYIYTIIGQGFSANFYGGLYWKGQRQLKDTCLWAKWTPLPSYVFLCISKLTKGQPRIMVGGLDLARGAPVENPW